jgi:hypothetical protein
MIHAAALLAFVSFGGGASAQSTLVMPCNAKKFGNPMQADLK